MADHPTLYDLLLLLSSDTAEDQREKILSGVQSAISAAGGSVERNDQWGRRPMAYEIRHQPDADYHLLQFQSPASLIEELSHTLRITDGVLRFRVIKVRPGTPAAKSSPPPVVAAVSTAQSGFSGPAETSAAPTEDRTAPDQAEEEPDDEAGSEAAPTE